MTPDALGTAVDWDATAAYAATALTRWILRHAGGLSVEDVQDVAQDALERAWRRRDALVSPTPVPEAWLHTVTVNLLRDRWRRRKVRPVTCLLMTGAGEGDWGDHPDPAPGPEDIAIDRLAAAALIDGLAVRSPLVAETMRRHHVDGLDVHRAAAIEGVAIKTIYSRPWRGERWLREMVGAHGARRRDVA